MAGASIKKHQDCPIQEGSFQDGVGRAELGPLKHRWGLVAEELMLIHQLCLCFSLLGTCYTQDVSVTQKTSIQPRVVVEDSCNTSI